MKKFTLLILFLSMMAMSFGQAVRSKAEALVIKEPPYDLVVNQNITKGSGDVFWQTTFNWKDTTNPRGWTLPKGWSVKDNSDLGNVWVWRQNTVKGNFTNITAPPSWFTSTTDGFIVLPMDEYNSRDGVTTSVAVDSYIETELIDCSAVSSVVLKFNQYFRYCCNVAPGLDVLASTDGVHWSSPMEVSYGTVTNIFTLARGRSVELNITELAAGSKSLRIRFYWHGPSHYLWMIDDLRLVESYQNNLVLEDVWADSYEGKVEPDGNINYQPITQLGMLDAFGVKIGSYKLKGAVFNAGMLDQYKQAIDFQILRNGQEILKKSASRALMTLERDTLLMPDLFLATDYGDYRFNYTAVGDAPDEVPANNTLTVNFTVNDTLFHRADFTTETSEGNGGYINANFSGDMAGTGYDIVAPCEINSIYARFQTRDTTITSTEYQFTLFKKMGDADYAEVISSEVAEFKPSMERTWQSMPMIKDGESEFLTPGFYIACVRMLGTIDGNADGKNGMRVGVDTDAKWNGDYAFFYRVKPGDWLSTSLLSQIGMVLNQKGGPKKAPVTFNVDMTKHIGSGEFKPGNDFVDVSGTFNGWSGSAHLTDPENDGIYTITLPDMPVGDTIQYKYRINANLNTSEFPNGGPNRKYRVRYWNVLNDVYNGGVTTGVDQTSLVASFNVYPNPTRGAFNVVVTNTVPSDLVITLSNIQGQVIYRNTIENVISHQETIDNKLAKGLYFLTINNGKEVKVQKVIVQ